nr:5'-deoxyadenosine deaminase [Enterobacter sp.]
MRCYPSLPVKAFFDGFEWKSGGWLFKQIDKSGDFVIEFDKTAEKSSILAITSFINTHAHISHPPRYSNKGGSDVLEGKPNLGGRSFTDNVFNSSNDCTINGVNIVCSSIRPENVNDFLNIYNDLPIKIIPFISVKHYHDKNLIVFELTKITRFFDVYNVPVRPAIIIHSLYNITEDDLKFYCEYALKNRIVISIHLFEWEGELLFYQKPYANFNDSIYLRMKRNWQPINLGDCLTKIINNKFLMKILVHCSYTPKQLLNINCMDNTLITLCPASCIRLNNPVLLPMDLNNIAIATDGYYTNMGYNLINELKVYNVTSRVRNKYYEANALLSSITGNPQKFISHSGLITDRKLIHNFRNLNFYKKTSGYIPDDFIGTDFINYNDSYQRFFHYE